MGPRPFDGLSERTRQTLPFILGLSIMLTSSKARGHLNKESADRVMPLRRHSLDVGATSVSASTSAWELSR